MGQVKSQMSCSWCHTLNDINEQYCSYCGHEATKARMDCQCRRCQNWRVTMASQSRRGEAK